MLIGNADETGVASEAELEVIDAGLEEVHAAQRIDARAFLREFRAER